MKKIEAILNARELEEVEESLSGLEIEREDGNRREMGDPAAKKFYFSQA